MTEEWRPVVGWEGLYEVSSEGRARSLDRESTERDRFGGQRRVVHRGRILKLSPHPRTGHLLVGLSNKTFYIHRLVAEAFLPNPEGHPCVLHWDDDPTNNRVENLRWGTQADNMRDAKRNGRIPEIGSRSVCPQGHKFTVENTYRSPQGYLICRACRLNNQRARKEGGIPDEFTNHGLSGYTSYNCRCETCVNAAREYRASRKH